MTPVEFVKNKWIEIAVNAFITILVVFIGFWLTSWESSKKALEQRLDKKADVVWVTEKFTDHEKTEAERKQAYEKRYESIEKMFEVIMQSQNELRKDLRLKQNKP